MKIDSGILAALLIGISPIAAIAEQEIKLIPFTNLDAQLPMKPEIDLGSGQSGPGFQFGERGGLVVLTPQDTAADWSGRGSLSLRIYAGGPPDAKIIISIFPQDDAGGSYWWARITADWEGWKEMELQLGGKNANEGLVASNKAGHTLPATFEKIGRIEIRNQWGSGAPESASWAIPEPSPGLWGLDWIEVK
jgi:hypothetical protein